MNTILVLLIRNLPSIACAIGAIILALHSAPVWGWFLLTALVINPVFLRFLYLTEL